jgi:hypothetical protein
MKVFIILLILVAALAYAYAHSSHHHHHHHGYHDHDHDHDDDDHHDDHDEVVVPYQRCIVASTSQTINCSSVFNASLLNPDPYFISDGPVYPTLQMALDDCPFSPVLIEVHGTVLASDNLVFSQNKDLFIRGVYSAQNPSKIVRFSNVHVVHTGHVLEFDNIVLEGCQANHSLFTSDGTNPCLTNVDVVFAFTITQNYNGSVLVCLNHTDSCGSSVRHELIATNSKFLDITGEVIRTQGVAEVTITRNLFCPRSPTNATYLSIISSDIFEISHNTFCDSPENNVDFIV